MILFELVPFELLRVIWWFLMGVMLIAFAITDGFDMGTGVLLPFVTRSDVERRVVILDSLGELANLLTAHHEVVGVYVDHSPDIGLHRHVPRPASPWPPLARRSSCHRRWR